MSQLFEYIPSNYGQVPLSFAILVPVGHAVAAGVNKKERKESGNQLFTGFQNCLNQFLIRENTYCF